MEPLLVICPQAEENPRLAAVLSHALEGRSHVKVQRPDQLHPVTGQRVLFAISLLHGGVNLGWYAMLSAIRQNSHFFDGCRGAVLVDGDGELYTKSAARELVFAANQAGCAFMGVKNRYPPTGLETEDIPLPDGLFARLTETQDILRAII